MPSTTNGALQKAYIYNDDLNTSVLECLFNPTQYVMAKTNSWAKTSLKGSNVDPPDFQGGQLMSMNFDLMFDTSIDGTDVRTHTDKLLDLMKIDPTLQNVATDKKYKVRPPICSFHWGNQWSFKGVFLSINLTFNYFTADGTPVRAKATVHLQQVVEDGSHPRQNPTSGGDGTQSSRLVQPGDTLDLIAHQVYGDSTQWRPIAVANGIDNPRALQAGRRLIVP